MEKKENDTYSSEGNHLFTEREKDILQLLIAGKTSREIADELFISKYTVDKHRRNMLRKTNAKNTAEMIMRVMWGGKMDNENEKEKNSN